MIESYRVHSRNIKSIGYDSNTKILELKFLVGNVEKYKNVPKFNFYNLLVSDSKTDFFMNNISDKYPQVN